jgi:hypothetical protein
MRGRKINLQTVGCSTSLGTGTCSGKSSPSKKSPSLPSLAHPNVTSTSSEITAHETHLVLRRSFALTAVSVVRVAPAE